MFFSFFLSLYFIRSHLFLYCCYVFFPRRTHVIKMIRTSDFSHPIDHTCDAYAYNGQCLPTYIHTNQPKHPYTISLPIISVFVFFNNSQFHQTITNKQKPKLKYIFTWTSIITSQTTNSEIRKARAPSPPSMKNSNSAASTNDKFYLQLTNESSYCWTERKTLTHIQSNVEIW